MDRVYVYILRTASLVAREPNVAKLESLLAAGSKDHPGTTFAVQRVTAQDPSEITQELVRALVDVSPSTEIPENFRAMVKPLHVNQLSNALKHLTALRMIVENAKKEPAAAHVVVEDDVLFNDDVAPMLLRTLEAAAKGPETADYDLVFLGLPTTAAGTPQDVRFEPCQRVFTVLPCCDSYVIRPAAAEKLLRAFLPVRFATHVHLSQLLAKQQPALKALSATPNAFIDGSKLGVFMSSLEQNNALLWNPQYNAVRRLLDAAGSSEPSAEARAEIESLLEAAHFKEHPDFLYLAARARVICGDHAGAEQAFTRAFDVYVAERCVFGPESQFMKDYVRVFRNLQPPV